jgi:hypothetical protein
MALELNPRFEHAYRLWSEAKLRDAVTALMICGHGHWFGVYIDGFSIAVNRSGRQCLIDAGIIEEDA